MGNTKSKKYSPRFAFWPLVALHVERLVLADVFLVEVVLGAGLARAEALPVLVLVVLEQYKAVLLPLCAALGHFLESRLEFFRFRRWRQQKPLEGRVHILVA